MSLGSMVHSADKGLALFVPKGLVMVVMHKIFKTNYLTYCSLALKSTEVGPLGVPVISEVSPLLNPH